MRIDVLDISHQSLTRLINILSEEHNLDVNQDDIEVVGRSIDNTIFFKINGSYVGSLFFDNNNRSYNFELNDLRRLDMSISEFKQYTELEGKLSRE